MDNNTCRLCLNNNAYINITINKFDNLIQKYSNIHINEHDSLPQKLCKTCLNKLQDFDKFITQCIENDEILKEQHGIVISKGYIIIEDTNNLLSNLDEDIDISCDDGSNIETKYNPTVLNCKVEPKDESKILNNDESSLTKSPLLVKCESCDKIVTKNKLKDHQKRVHSMHKNFICHICSKGYNTRYDLTRHLMRAHKTTSIKCMFCDVISPNQRALKVHILIMHPKPKQRRKALPQKKSKTESNLSQESIANKTMCGVCGKYVLKLEIHKRIHSEHLYDCEHCEKKFKLQRYLSKHVKTMHADKQAICDLCNEMFTSKTILMKHLSKTHSMGINEEEKCKTVVKESVEKPISKALSRKRLNKRTVCELCGKAVRRLKDHYNIHHSSERQFSCEFCNEKFKIQRYLCHHINNMHKPDTRVTCQICSKSYSRRMYKRHMIRVHTTEKNLACDCCDKKFKDKYSLQSHYRTHTREKPYQCKFCDSTFTLSSSRLDHERLHMGVTPYKCPSCPKSFTQLSNMKSHFKHNHKDIVFSEVYKPSQKDNKPSTIIECKKL